MATDQYVVCSKCEHSDWAAGRLYDALRNVVQGKKARCSKCGASAHLELNLDFALSPRQRYMVLDAFLPQPPLKWKHGKSTVAPYPFLVMMKPVDGGACDVWLPYWQVVTDGRGHSRTKYGQWAPFIRDDRFASLVRQARNAGYNV